MENNVVPFGPRPPKAAPASAERPPEDAGLHRSTRRAAPGAKRLAAEQNAAGRHAYIAAALKQRHEKTIAEGEPVPARITIALDAGGHEGPEVDLAVGTWEGNPAGDVDAWEDTDDPRLPSAEQVRLLADLTGFPEVFFYTEHIPQPLSITICGEDGCETYADDGVPVPPAKQAGQHALPGMPVPAAAPARRASRDDGRDRARAAAAQAATRPAPKAPAPAPAQQAMPPGRLSDEAREALRAQLAKAAKKYR